MDRLHRDPPDPVRGNRSAASAKGADESMTASVIHIVLLWVAVFAGLDIAFGEGALTEGAGQVLERALKRIRELLGF